LHVDRCSVFPDSYANGEQRLRSRSQKWNRSEYTWTSCAMTMSCHDARLRVYFICRGSEDFCECICLPCRSIS